MASYSNNDWYQKIRKEMIQLIIKLKELRECIVIFAYHESWILEDHVLFEEFSHLKEMVDISNCDLELFKKRLDSLDEKSIVFDVNDLKDEFEFIKQNIWLENMLILNISYYIAVSVNPFFIDYQAMQQYLEDNKSYYDQMRSNNKNLKQLRKEGRDYFE